MNGLKIKSPDMTAEALIIGVFIWVAGCSVADAIKDVARDEADYRYKKERFESIKTEQPCP